MATRKSTTTRRKPGVAAKRRRSPAAGKKGPSRVANILVPLVFMAGITFCLGYLLIRGYQSVAASSFFDVKTIDIRGVHRASKDEIENIVSRQTSQTGVWNANLAEIKSDIEKLTYVKDVSVSRVLPDGLRVIVAERQPLALVSLAAGDFWVDDAAVLLSKADQTEERPPFVLKGWDETKSLQALEQNKERVKIYRQMLEEWQDFELAKRVAEVDLKDLDEVRAIVRDSGETVTINLGKDNFGKSLREALKKIANKGKEIKSFDVMNSVAAPRDS